MEILKQLSSQQGDKTEASNKNVAEQCIANPLLLDEIADGLLRKEKKLQSDSIEVFTLVSEKHPELIIKYADKILSLLLSKETKTRWEAVHTLSHIADKIPDAITSVLPGLKELISTDKSTIVRDHALYTISNYAKTSVENAERSYGILKSALDLWGEKHAKQVIGGLGNIVDNIPMYKSEIHKIVFPYLSSNKKVVVAEAKKVIKQIEN